MITIDGAMAAAARLANIMDRSVLPVSPFDARRELDVLRAYLGQMKDDKFRADDPEPSDP